MLADIAADVRLRHLPVIILTSFAARRDILSLYSLRASSYIVKPVNFKRFQQTIRALHQYWFSAVMLPGDSSETSAA